MEIFDLLKLLNNETIEKIVSLFNLNLAPKQPNYSQNSLNNSYFQLPSYSNQPRSDIPPPTNDIGSIVELIKLLLPLLQTKKKPELTTISSDEFKSEILSLPKIK